MKLGFTLSYSGLLAAALILVSSLHSHASWKVQTIRGPKGARLLAVQKSQASIGRGQHLVIQHLPRYIDEGHKIPSDLYQEFLVDDHSLSPEMTTFAQNRLNDRRNHNIREDVDYKIILGHGNPENRINLTFLGDGYRESERDKFLNDVRSLTKQILAPQTYGSFAPIFNIYAVFNASAESGIGDGKPKNTTFKLYRAPAGSKRDIFPGDEAAIEKALTSAPQTDYPIIIANDEGYGGLGGRYAITTNSTVSGVAVLRHELGHNFGNVGEESDGSGFYTGANFSPTPNVSWDAWVNLPKPQEAISLLENYPWQDLKNHSLSLAFDLPKGLLLGLEWSGVDWDTADDVRLLLDKKDVKFTGVFNGDRNFYTKEPGQLASGNHTLTFEADPAHTAKTNPVLAYVKVTGYPVDYNFQEDRIGAFATFDAGGKKVGYRPTNNSCLMRDLSSSELCPVDRENIWLKFLNRINLIDVVDIKPAPIGRMAFTTATPARIIQVRTPPLKGLVINWFRMLNGNLVEVENLRNLWSWRAEADVAGNYLVRVTFATSEVKRPTRRFVIEKNFSL